MKVWILQTGEPIPIDEGLPRPMRAINLTNKLMLSGHKVVLWSSEFCHQTKLHRNPSLLNEPLPDGLEIKLIQSPGYKQNLGIARLYDHFRLGKNLDKILGQQDSLPDVVFIGFPPIEPATSMLRFCQKHKIPVILDIKDQWPTIFLDRVPLPLRFFARSVFHPYFKMSAYLFNEANVLCSITDDFLRWGQEFGNRSLVNDDLVVPLSVPKLDLTIEELHKAKENWKSIGVDLEDGKKRFCFVGSLSSSFDFAPIKELAANLQKQKIEVQIILAGQGAQYTYTKRMMMPFDNVVLPGHISHHMIAALYHKTTATLAPYNDSTDFAMSIPNKIIDSMSFGLPVISCLRGEVARLLTSEGIGLRYSNANELYDAVIKLAKEDNSWMEMKKRSFRLYNERFDFDQVYDRLINAIKKLTI